MEKTGKKKYLDIPVKLIYVFYIKKDQIYQNNFQKLLSKQINRKLN